MNNFIEYVRQVNMEIGLERGFLRGLERGLKLIEERGEEQVKVTVVTNMLRNGRNAEEIQMALGMPVGQILELIHDVQANTQEYFGK